MSSRPARASWATALLLCVPLAVTASVANAAPGMSSLDERPTAAELTLSTSAQAGPNCANIMAQAGSAAVGLFAQSQQLIKVCTAQGWTSGPCIAQGLVVASAALWFWWTGTQYYCACTQNPNANYCAAVGALPAPPNPNPPGGGNNPLPPAGPPLPKADARLDVADHATVLAE